MASAKSYGNGPTSWGGSMTSSWMLSMPGKNELMRDSVMMLGKQLFLERKFRQASMIFEKLVKEDPKNPDLWYMLGNCSMESGKDKEAIKFFDKAIGLNRNYSKAYNNRGSVYCKMGKFILALNDFNSAIKTDMENFAAYNNRAVMRLNIQNVAPAHFRDLEAAIMDFTKAIELQPESDTLYFNRGLTYNLMGYFSLAVEDFDKALHNNLRYKDAYLQRAFALCSMGDSDSGLADLQKAARFGATLEDVDMIRRAGLGNFELRQLAEGQKETDTGLKDASIR